MAFQERPQQRLCFQTYDQHLLDEGFLTHLGQTVQTLWLYLTIPPEKLKAVPRGGGEVWVSLLTSSWQPVVNECKDTLKSKLRVCTLGSYLLYNCKNINDCVSVQIWIQIKFFPTYTDNKGYSIRFYSQCSWYLLCLWVRVTFTGSEGSADLWLCYYSLFNQCLSFHQWVKIKVSFESGVS